MDNRIGYLNPDGSIKSMPEVSLAGNPYASNQDRLGIGNGQFVILDRGLAPELRSSLVAGLKTVQAKNTTTKLPTESKSE